MSAFTSVCHTLCQNKDDLTTLMMKVFSDGLEGLVLKDTNVR